MVVLVVVVLVLVLVVVVVVVGGGGGVCDGKTWSISRWGCAPLPGPGPDLKTSGFLIFLIFLIIDLYQVQIWRFF